MLNYAVRYYGLESNSMAKVGEIGSKQTDEMSFWIKDKYLCFSRKIMDKPQSFIVFELLVNSVSTIKDGLTERIEDFVITHPDLKLVFIDAFQQVRRLTGDSVYAANYGDFSVLKFVADKYGLVMLVVHHTLKMTDDGIMDTVSGSSGITESADSIWVLKKALRGAGDATLIITGRDVEFRGLKLALRDCCWNLIEHTSEEELEEREIPKCILRIVEFVTECIERS